MLHLWWHTAKAYAFIRPIWQRFGANRCRMRRCKKHQENVDAGGRCHRWAWPGRGTRRRGNERSSAEVTEDDAFAADDEEVSVMRKVKAALCISHSAKDIKVYTKYIETANTVCKTLRSAINHASRLSQFLSTAESSPPTLCRGNT